MEKTIATICIVVISLVLSSNPALAQKNTLPTPDDRPKKNNHGQTVSTAAHQEYATSGKGKFISEIARLKNKAFGPVKKGWSKAKNAPKPKHNTHPDQKPVKAVKVKSRAVPSRNHLLAHKPAPGARPIRVYKSNAGRRPAGTGRFTQIGRG